MPLPVQSEQSSKFFPRSCKQDIDGPPISMLDAAKEKVLSMTQGLPEPVGLHVQQEHLRLLADSPGYASFFLTFLERHERLLKAKPILVQEYVAHDPWKLLVAVMLLNKTAGRVAVPIFWTLITRWPTPESLAKADPVELEDCIRCLGLQSLRARRLISLSAAYLEQRDHNKPRQPESQNLPSIAISHLPGSGPYALDSYCIYCGGPDDWRAVVPHDKELIRFIKWRWAAHGVQWSPTLGMIGPANESYIENLIHELVALDPYIPR